MSKPNINTNPKISIIVPIYNAEDFLSDCIHSILSQTYKNFELILIDDGSTDKSKYIYSSITDKRVRILHQNNTGASSARNTGLHAATGEYITFVDADDTISPNMLSVMTNAIISTNADMAVYNLKNRHQTKEHPATWTLFEAISYNYCWETCGKLIRRSMISHPFDLEIVIGEDLLFYYDNYKTNQNYVFVDENDLYHYNLHPGSLMHNKTTLKDISCLDVLLRIINDVELSLDLRTFYKAYYIQVYYRLFARSSRSPQIELARKRYYKYIKPFYKDAKQYHYVTIKIFFKHRMTWAYNIIERLQAK